MPLSTNQQPFIYRALIIYTVDIPEYLQTEKDCLIKSTFDLADGCL